MHVVIFNLISYYFIILHKGLVGVSEASRESVLGDLQGLTTV